MPRTARKAPGGVIFHVLNRGVGKRGLFEKDQDFAAFERVLAHALEQVPIDLFAYSANAVRKAQNWPWSSLGRRFGKPRKDRIELPLAQWPAALPEDWLQWVNEPQTDKELEALRLSLSRGKPFGAEKWCEATSKRLGLESRCRKHGRPRKQP
jgi:hypothetical protein